MKQTRAPRMDTLKKERERLEMQAGNEKLKQFVNYTEDAALDWRSGFVLLTYKDSRLMYPELVSVWDDKSVQFRGEIIRV